MIDFYINIPNILLISLFKSDNQKIFKMIDPIGNRYMTSYTQETLSHSKYMIVSFFLKLSSTYDLKTNQV